MGRSRFRDLPTDERQRQLRRGKRLLAPLRATILCLPLALAGDAFNANAPALLWWGLAALFLHITLERATIAPKVEGWQEDRRSKALLALTFFIASLIAFGDRGRGPWLTLQPAIEWALCYTGLALLVLGDVLRQWAISTLGDAFTDRARISEGQQLIRRGPYARVRHPAYSGLLLVFVGVPLIVASLPGLAASVLLCLPALRYRIRVEEQLLERHFGAEWMDYAARTPRLLPGLRNSP